VRIRYLHEGTHAEAALETLGGIVNALDHLGRRPFIVASSDLVTDFDYATLAPAALDLAHDRFDAHLVLVDNPPHHPRGDLGFDGLRATRTAPLLNYAGIGVFAPHLFAGLAPSRQPLFPWLYQFVERGRISAQHHRGAWHNVGTPAQLAALDHELSRGGAPAARSP
jgi:MurNAc alpha-1-phosphate uridylyltransferase